MEQNYLYNGKELQDELNLGWLDYGARMYQAEIGRFFTQDRFADKYYSLSPYQYGGLNPINIVDINGDSLWIQVGNNEKNRALYLDGKLYNSDGKTLYNGKGVKRNGAYSSFLTKTLAAVNDLSSSSVSGNGVIADLQSSENNFTIRRGDNGLIASSARHASANLEEFSVLLSHIPKTGSGGTIFFNPNSRLGGLNTNNNRSRPPFIGLAHELFHASDSNLGLLYPETDFNNASIGLNYSSTIDGLSKAEISAVNQENQLRNELGIPLRQFYGMDKGQSTGPRLVPFFMNFAKYLYR